MSPTPRPIQPDDLFTLRFLQSAALSPDGRRAAYVVSTYDAEADEDRAHIWLVELEDGQARQMTHGAHSNSNPQWAPDGQTLAFVSTRAEKPQIYLLPVDGGEARALTQLPQGVGADLAWSPNGAKIAFTAGPPENAAPNLSKPYRLTRHVYRFDATGYLDTAVQDIYAIDAAGGEPTRLTHDAAMNTQPHWAPGGAPGGERILYAASMLPDSFRSIAPVLRTVNLAGEQQDFSPHLSADWGYISSFAWTPNGDHVVFTGTPSGKPIGSKADLWVIGADGRSAPENRTATLAIGVGGGLQPDMPTALFRSRDILVTADGATAFVQVQDGGAIQIYRVALHGPEAHEAILSGERACVPLGLQSAAGKLLYWVSGFNQPPDLFVSDLEGGNEAQLTGLNGAAATEMARPTVEQLHFSGADGAAVEGWLIAPPHGEPPYPTILYIHGGPHSAFGHMYHFDTQMLTGAGYAVLMVNHRASTGYGDVFSTAIKGDWGNLDYTDLMAGVDAAIDCGLVDANRLGVCGLSGGGNLSCWIVGQTDRFKAAVPENPVTNWVSFYGVSDIGVWFAVEELGGHPHEIPDVYVRCSPISYAHRCTTPTLLVQCEADYRCPAEQAEQFYNVLKANGCVVEMLRLPGGSHAGAIGGKPAIRRAQNEALLEWMQRYV
ncbi:MAG: S9 family peptidase [Caldilineaceae bacterium]|nr:S9 family peptidase [Caldilineaceae bacterium]